MIISDHEFKVTIVSIAIKIWYLLSMNFLVEYITLLYIALAKVLIRLMIKHNQRIYDSKVLGRNGIDYRRLLTVGFTQICDVGFGSDNGNLAGRDIIKCREKQKTKYYSNMRMGLHFVRGLFKFSKVKSQLIGATKMENRVVYTR